VLRWCSSRAQSSNDALSRKEDELKKAMEQLSDLQRRLATAEDGAAHKDAELDRLHEDVEGLKWQVEEERRRAAESERALNSLRAELDSTRHTLTEEINRLKTSNSDKADQLRGVEAKVATSRYNSAESHTENTLTATYQPSENFLHAVRFYFA
jgi:chromosome segregation ATPase